MYYKIVLFGLVLLDRSSAIARGGNKKYNHNNNFFFNNNNKPDQSVSDDPYRILGIPRTASDDTIQKAYRQRAKETHPDKNSSPSATEEFRRVTSAYEILGDPDKRKRYDRAMDEEAKRRRHEEYYRRRQRQQKQKGGRSSSSSSQQTQNNNLHTKERRKRQHEDMMMNKSKAASRGLKKIVTMHEFETEMLDSSKKMYKTNCLIMFVGNKNAEKWAETHLFFPYPFTGDSQNTLLMVSKVRFNTHTDLTRLFRAELNSNTPHIVFAKRGDFVRNYQVFPTKKIGNNNIIYGDAHQIFQNWVESLLDIPVTVANHHGLPVEVRVLRDRRVMIYGESLLNPNYERAFALRVGDRIIAFDERVDTFPGAIKNEDLIAATKGVLLLDVTITLSAPRGSFHYTISPTRCYDLSTQCSSWVMSSRRGTTKNDGSRQCNTHPEFMHHICPYTCGVCSENYIVSDIAYLAFQRPIHSFPIYLRFLVRWGRHLVLECVTMATEFGTAAIILFAAGMLLTFNIASYSRRESKASRMNQSLVDESPIVAGMVQVLEICLLLVTVTMVAGVLWMLSVRTVAIPPILRGIHRDILGLTNISHVFSIVSLLVGILSGANIRFYLSKIIRGKNVVFPYFLLLIIMATCAISMSFFMLDTHVDLNMQWNHIWKYHQDAVYLIASIGTFVGMSLIFLEQWILFPLLDRLPFLTIICDLIVMALVAPLALMDAHFFQTMMKVILLKKYGSIACVVFGLVVGDILGNYLDALDSGVYSL